MSAAFVYDEALTRPILRPDHPLKAERARACHDLLRAAGVFDSGAARVVRPAPATRDDVLRAHEAGYVHAVESLSLPMAQREDVAARWGLSSHGDTPAFEGMYDYYVLSAGAAIEAVRAVDAGESDVAFSPAGGVNHHAMPGHASGFGVLNDAAIAIAWLRARGRRVMYLDLDVHHGDGVEATFEDDDGVLTVSLHESTQYLFPGPKGGFAENVGTARGEGYSVNVPLAPYTGDDVWLWAFDEIVPPLHAAFQPDVLLVQLGADGYFADPLAHLLLTERAYRGAARRLRELTGGRLAAVGGGGYDVAATPRIWAMEFVTLAGIEVDLPGADGTPPAVGARVAEQVREFAERSVETVKRLVFPRHGIG
jgi:acetoin utilization protein AcuC